MSRSSAPAEVTLGDHTSPVYAQRHAYLLNRLGRYVDELLESVTDLDTTGLPAALQTHAYGLLAALIPSFAKRVPEYEFKGYADRAAMDAEAYDPEADRSPTLPEIREAFAVASRVNGFDILTHLGKVLDPSLLRGVVNAQVAEAISQTSPTSPSANGTSGLTSSGTTPPTSTPSEG
jgi:hypothetical protein